MSNQYVQVKKLRELSGHKGSVFALAVDAQEKYLFSAGDDGILAMWDLRSDKASGTGILRSERSIYCLLYIEEYDWIVGGTSDGQVHIVDVQKKTLLHTYHKSVGAVFDFWYDANSGHLWVLQANGWLNMLRLPDFVEKSSLKISKEHLRVIIPNLQKDLVYIGCSDHHIYCLDSNNVQIRYKWPAHNNSVFALALHPDKRHLLSGGRDAHVNVWNLGHPPVGLQKIPAHNFTINDIVFSPSETFFVTASRDKTIKLWDSSNFELKKVVNLTRNDGHKHSVNKIKWLKGENSVISCSDDRRIILWQFSLVSD